MGQTFIITNAGAGWVEMSSLRFLPKLYKEVIENAKDIGITIVSARSLYEKEMPSMNLMVFTYLEYRWIYWVES